MIPKLTDLFKEIKVGHPQYFKFEKGEHSNFYVTFVKNDILGHYNKDSIDGGPFQYLPYKNRTITFSLDIDHPDEDAYDKDCEDFIDFLEEKDFKYEIDDDVLYLDINDIKIYSNWNDVANK